MRVAVGMLAWLASAIVMGTPREDVGEIATLINDYYFDVQRAASIASDLRREADSGAFDRLKDPNDLAVALTRRLKTIDGHFNVVWEAESGVAAAPPPRESARRADAGPTPAETAPHADGGPADPGGGEPVAGESSSPADKTSGARASEPSREMRPVAPADFETVDRRANYGFRRVDRLPGNIGYIELTYIANIDFAQPDSPARRAADAALALVRGTDAVILDLRENGGGSASMVGYLVSAFTERGRDVYNVFHSRTGTESERPDIAYPEPMPAVPLYVLTSGRTASAAEAIAYTLQTSGRAKVIGERSAGAANPGMMFRTSRGFAIFVSTGAPKNPLNGKSWERDGVQPDVETSNPLTRAQVLALENVLAGPIAGIDRVDAQWALDALRVSARPFKPARLASYSGTYGPFEIAVADGSLEAKRGRQPALVLVPVQADLFFVRGEPSRRFSFVREKDRVVALEMRRSRGDGQRFNRE